MRPPEIVRDGARDHTRPLASTSDAPACRIAIIGPNGAGKSTLLKLILNKEQPSEGRAEIVAANAVTQYFEQDQANALPLDHTVLQCLEDAASDTRCDHYDNQNNHHRHCHHCHSNKHNNDRYEYEQLRALLGKFMFKEEKVHDKVSLLSGGEKARVALCRMMLTKANLLLLDEPTNHLDIAAKEVSTVSQWHASPAAGHRICRSRASADEGVIVTGARGGVTELRGHCDHGVARPILPLADCEHDRRARGPGGHNNDHRNEDHDIESTNITTTPGAQRVRRRLPDIHGAQRGCEGEDRGPLH